MSGNAHQDGDLQERLRTEAAALRRSRRLHRRVMAVYIGVALLFISVRIAQGIRKLTPEYVRVVVDSPPVPHIVYAVMPPRDRDSNPGPLGDYSSGAPIPIEHIERIDPQVEWSRLVTQFPAGIATTVGMLGWVVFALTRRATRRQAAAAREILKIKGVASIGGLAESLRVDDPNVREAAERALVQLLPLLRAGDAALLDDEQHACLNRALFAENHDLARAILAAWEQVGDERDRSAVYRLSAGDGPARRCTDLRNAAQECLPYLAANEDRRRTNATLLRPSENACSEQDLLRPASAEHHDTADLLRASANS